MADLIFNPLLKKGFQYDNTAAIQTEIDAMQENLNALQNQKITKCFTAADLANLEDNEIFEWQGASGTVDETAFVNGYFYKKTFLPATVQVLILYHNYAYINGEYLADTYYYSHSEDPGLTQYNSTRNIDNKSVVWIGNSTPNVGDLVTISSGENSQSFVSITNKEIVDLQFRYTDSNGDVWSLNGSVYSRAITYNYYTNSQGVTINVNWDTFFDNMGFVCSYNGKLYLVKWTNYGSTGAKFDTVVNPEGSANYSATDTQSRLLNIENASNGDINITQNLNVSGDLNVTGTQRIVHTEEIDSENDFIKLRYNNPLALANDEQSGIKVENYDGNNNNCIFGVDNAGWARIGDEGGTLQKLATIQETPTDGAFVKYNNTTKELESTTDGSALTVTFTPDTSATINHINSGDTLAAIAQKISKLLVITPSFIASVSNPTRLYCILFNNVLFIQAYELQFIEGLSDFAKICSFPQSLILSQEYNYGIYANTTTNNYVNTIYVSYSSVENFYFISLRGSVGVNQSISFNMIAI